MTTIAVEDSCTQIVVDAVPSMKINQGSQGETLSMPKDIEFKGRFWPAFLATSIILTLGFGTRVLFEFGIPNQQELAIFLLIEISLIAFAALISLILRAFYAVRLRNSKIRLFDMIGLSTAVPLESIYSGTFRQFRFLRIGVLRSGYWPLPLLIMSDVLKSNKFKTSIQNHPSISENLSAFFLENRSFHNIAEGRHSVPREKRLEFAGKFLVLLLVWVIVALRTLVL
ncbi:MAG: hypothetical protein GF350_06585 [Chitinivibrionales bacterium]|nr:hypothetical protein [Chitinivibrionales bacterium]